MIGTRGELRRGAHVQTSMWRCTWMVAVMACAATSAEGPAESEPRHRETSGGEVAEPEPTASAAEPDPGPASVAAEPVTCEQIDMMTVQVPMAAWEVRRGHDATRFAELVTTQEKPLEECGLQAVLQRLATLRCEDGSNPYAGDLGVAHRSRRGNTGPGGRCGMIIDLYAATCPEQTYEVFADMYFCPAR